MVFPWGPSVYHYRVRHGRCHDTRVRISVLGASKEEIGSHHALGHDGLIFRHHLPMVLLGLFSGIFRPRNKRVHWRPKAFWLDQYARRSQSWLATDTGVAV